MIWSCHLLSRPLKKAKFAIGTTVGFLIGTTIEAMIVTVVADM
jgi:hypothetical protein